MFNRFWQFDHAVPVQRQPLTHFEELCSTLGSNIFSPTSVKHSVTFTSLLYTLNLNAMYNVNEL